MTDTTPTSTPPPGSRPPWLPLALLAGLLVGIGMALRRLRRTRAEPAPPTPSVTAATPAPVSPPVVTPSAAPPPPPRQVNLGRALLGVILVAIVLIVIWAVVPEVSAALLILIVLAPAIISLSNLPGTPGAIGRELARLPLYPPALVIAAARFYWRGRSHPAQASPAIPDNTPISVVVSIGLLCGVLLALILLPVSLPVGLIVAVPVIGLGWASRRLGLDPLILLRRLRGWVRQTRPLALELPVLSRRWLVVEMLLILAVTYFAAQDFLTAHPARWYSGREAQWLTSAAYAASDGLREYGRFPLWQPYLEQGEPLLENPFAFIFNPISGLPSLLTGPEMGLRISVFLSALVAGLGGWFLGRMLGLSWAGRVLLAGLLIGKGNMHTMINNGYFQLGVSQAYIPWVIGGTLAVLRLPRARWPVALTAIFAALLYFAGNLWYVLPTAVGALSVAAVYIIGAGGRWLDRQAIRRLLLTTALAAGIGAVTLVPLVAHFNRIGGHASEIRAGWEVPIEQVALLFFNADPTQQLSMYFPMHDEYWLYTVKGQDEFYFSYVAPWWWLAVLLLIPFYRPGGDPNRRFWIVALVSFLLGIVWGTGGNPLYLWAYRELPLIGQWRFVGRALAVSSFWLAVLVAMRADALWLLIRRTDWAGLLPRWPGLIPARVPLLLGGLLLGMSSLAVYDVNRQWRLFDDTLQEPLLLPQMCLDWLRQQHPGEQLTVWQQNYHTIIPFLRLGIRTWNVQADFEIVPDPSTVGNPELNLNLARPRYAMPEPIFRPVMTYNRYRTMPNSPQGEDQEPCMYEWDGGLPYAYMIEPSVVENIALPEALKDWNLPYDQFIPITALERRADQIALIVPGQRPREMLVAVAERAYPGWTVQVNGQPAALESVGGQIGVRLAPGVDPVQVYFEYRPPLLMLGGVITILASLLCAAYLLLRRNQTGKPSPTSP
ncbi:MAG: hypothetical protein JNM70_09310 [Anaerolineae bacterium]|nr:hypothetical protein [Anaerolineae bacterium]